MVKIIFSPYFFVMLSCLTSILVRNCSSRPDVVWAIGPIVVWGILVSPGSERMAQRMGLFHVLFIATLCRAVYIGAPPLFSDDIYRYIWEGWLVSNGDNPFITSAMNGTGLENIRSKVNHPDMTSIYPPLALTLFGIFARISPQVWTFQVAAAVADLFTVVLLWRVQKEFKLPAWCGVIYAIHPLPVIESTLGGHIEVFAIPFVLAAVIAARARRGNLSAFLVLVSAGVKVFPVTMTIFLLRRFGHRAGLGLGFGTIFVVLALVPMIDAGPELLSSWHAYQDTWKFNPLIFPIAKLLFGEETRMVLIVVGALSTTLICLYASTLHRAWFFIAIVFVSLSPTVHPWYFLWLMVPAITCSAKSCVTACTFSFCSYLVIGTLDLESGVWTEPWWLGLVSWGPALAYLALAVPLRNALIVSANGFEDRAQTNPQIAEKENRKER